MKRLFGTITGLIITLCCGVPASAQSPQLSRADAEQVLTREYQNQAVYWQPQKLPALVPQSAVGEDARLLRQLAELSVIEREASMGRRSLGEGRGRIELNWIYRWPDPQHEGIYVGSRRIASVGDVGPVVNQGDGWFANVKVQWYVVDMPLWTEHPDLVGIRLLRRSRESSEKPFEVGLALVHEDDGWHLWAPSGVQ